MAGAMKRAVLIALGMAMVYVPVAWADGKANTRVTIDSAFVNPGETLFAGDIFSPRKACKNDRRVLIFRVRAGDDQKIGATRSDQALGLGRRPLGRRSPFLLGDRRSRPRVDGAKRDARRA